VSSENLPLSPLRPSCAACHIKLRLIAVEPHPDFGGAFEVHGFICTSCGRTQSYTLRRQSTAKRRAARSGDRHMLRPRRQRP